MGLCMSSMRKCINHNIHSASLRKDLIDVENINKRRWIGPILLGLAIFVEPPVLFILLAVFLTFFEDASFVALRRFYIGIRIF